MLNIPALLLALVTSTASAEEWPVPERIGPADELVITGENHGDSARIVILRIDDAASVDYWTRVNEERVVGKGPFTLSMSIAALRTPRGRALDVSALERLIVFDTGEDGDVEIDTVRLREAPDYGADVIALDLGPKGSAVYPGFTAIEPSDPRLEAKALKPLRRPSGDALIQDGMEGVDRLTLHVENGLWRVALFVQDQGEWEYLPHPLEQRILINGQIVLDQRLDAERWIEKVYLAGRDEEYRPGQDVFETVGRRRSGLIDTLVDVEDGRVVIQFDGPARAARYLAGVVVAPFENRDTIGEIQASRAQRMEERWRIAERSDQEPSRLWAVTVPGGFVSLHLPGARLLDYSYAPPQRSGFPLPLDVRVGRWHLSRPDTAANELVIDDRHLSSDLALDPLRPRSFWLSGRIPPSTSPGLYEGMLNGQFIGIEVLDYRRPSLSESIGIYLDDLPFEVWFKGVFPEQRACDLALLESFGLTTIAPVLATPKGDGLGRFRADLTEAASFSFSPPFLAYTPAKRLEQAIGSEMLPQHLAEVDRHTDAPVYWSIADEPHNLGRGYGDLIRKIRRLRQARPEIRLAGHLNYRGDDEIAGLFDLALINSGYGLDEQRVTALKRGGTRPWLYNMGHPRLAAGFYLWRIGAEGYVQWHGRMPTADPFDPTDGREADVQLLYPTNKPCQGDIDRDLIAMAEGVEDLRWLRWLEQEASQNAGASRLLQELRRTIPVDWTAAKSLKNERLQGIRARITELARRLLLIPSTAAEGIVQDATHAAFCHRSRLHCSWRLCWQSDRSHSAKRARLDRTRYAERRRAGAVSKGRPALGGLHARSGTWGRSFRGG